MKEKQIEEVLNDFLVNHLKTNNIVAKAMIEEYLKSKNKTL